MPPQEPAHRAGAQPAQAQQDAGATRPGGCGGVRAGSPGASVFLHQPGLEVSQVINRACCLWGSERQSR